MRRVRNIEAALAALHESKLFVRFCELWHATRNNAAAGIAWMLGEVVYDDPSVVTATFSEDWRPA